MKNTFFGLKCAAKKFDLLKITAAILFVLVIGVNYSWAEPHERIINNDTIDTVEGEFIDINTEYAGGAINNHNGTINHINAEFQGNASETSGVAGAGAIYSNSTIGDVTANFTGNYAHSTEAQSQAGAIYNEGTFETITGNFNSNYSLSETQRAISGAILNYGGTVDLIDGEFNSNYAKSNASTSVGGAVYNFGNDNTTGEIKNINADFISNGTIGNLDRSGTSGAYGGAIYNGTNGKIGNIKGDFKNNYSINTGSSTALGGAIHNTSAEIESIVGNFEGNYTRSTGRAYGGAINNAKDGNIGTIIGDFKNNGVVSENIGSDGGAVRNNSTGHIENITGNFTGNYAISTNGWAECGAVSNTSANGISHIYGDFIGNYAYSKNDSAQAGAIGNLVTVGTEIIPKFGVVSGNFINNYAKTDSDTYKAFGGAVYTRCDIEFLADGTTNKFSGNYTLDSRGKINNAIFARTNVILDGVETIVVPTVTLNAVNNGEFVFDDNIDGGEINADWTDFTRENQYRLEIKGDSSGKVRVNNEILSANIEHNDVTTYVKDYTQLNHEEGEGINSLDMKSGTMELGKMSLTPLHFRNFAMNGGTINIKKAEVDLANKQMSRITANTYNNSNGTGTVNVKSMHVRNDGKLKVTPVEFADKSFRDTVKSPVKTAYGPVYKYSVKYEQGNQISDLEGENQLDEQDENGYFVFRRTGTKGGGSKGFNPAVLAQVANVYTGNHAVMNETFEYVFEHLDAFTQFPRAQREALIASQEQGVGSTFNSNLGNIELSMDRKAAWVRPFAAFEKIGLSHGPKINMITYGTLVGYDSDFHRHDNGWVGVSTVYFGYNGAQIDFRGADTSMNGGLIGATQTFYKKNFWTAFTVSAGASTGESHTNFGSEHFTTLLGGIANKTGYNFEFKEGKYILQPIMYTSYTFAKTFDYTSSTGAKIDSGLGNYLELHPSVRFVTNLKRGWQLYAAAGIVWMPLHEGTARANGIRLPNAYIKPYAEYGLGLQRHWNDKYVAFGQAMVRNGGRNGVALTFGFRWKLGKEAM